MTRAIHPGCKQHTLVSAACYCFGPLLFTPITEYAFCWFRPSQFNPFSTELFAPTTANMDTLYRDMEKQWEEAGRQDDIRQEDRRRREHHKTQMNRLRDFAHRERRKTLAKEKAAQEANEEIEGETPHLNPPLKRRADAEGNDSAPEILAGVENTKVKRVKFTNSVSKSQLR